MKRKAKLKPCSVCKELPDVFQTDDGFYIACVPCQRETAITKTHNLAVFDWNMWMEDYDDCNDDDEPPLVKMTVKETAKDEAAHKQFEQRCWELFSSYPMTVIIHSPISAFDNAVFAVREFERKMKELQEEE